MNRDDSNQLKNNSYVWEKRNESNLRIMVNLCGKRNKLTFKYDSSLLIKTGTKYRKLFQKGLAQFTAFLTLYNYTIFSNESFLNLNLVFNLKFPHSMTEIMFLLLESHSIHSIVNKY